MINIDPVDAAYVSQSADTYEALWEFVEDVVVYTRMFYSEGVAACAHGEELQDEMLEKYPTLWMKWLFKTVGWFGEVAEHLLVTPR